MNHHQIITLTISLEIKDSAQTSFFLFRLLSELMKFINTII